MRFRDLNIETHRFLLRPLVVADASQEYLSWMRDDVAAQYIVAAPSTQSIKSLEHYILEKTTKADCLFLGIFDKKTRKHIGNIKYDPVDLGSSYATMGILIGESNYRGKGVAAEVIVRSSIWLYENYKINTIGLGVDFENQAGIRAYEKCGFVECNNPKSNPKFKWFEMSVYSLADVNVAR